jgi:membrane protein
MTGKTKQTFEKLKHRMERPHLVLATGWDILGDAIKNFQANGNTNQAAAISLYAMLSFIPLFILTMLLAGCIFSSHPNIQNELIEKIRGFHPYISESLLSQLGPMEQKKQLLGWVGIISLIWSSAMIFSAIETAMNMIFRSRGRRNYVVSNLLAIAMIPMGWAVGVASVGITYISTTLVKQPLLFSKDFMILPFLHGALFSFFLPYLLTVAFFTIVYKIIPSGKISMGSALTGAAIFAALMEIAKHFFAWYVSDDTKYNVIFGSLETVVILVLWVFYVALILLFCAELISSHQRRNLILLEKAFLKPRKKIMKVEERLFRKFGRMYPKDTYVFRQGDTGQEMYYILMGNVRVEKSAGQIKKVLAEMGQGEYFGEMAALIEAPRTASVQATEDSNVAVIDSDTFRSLLRESGDVSLFMLKEFSNRIRQTGNALGELSQSWIRLIAVLYFLMKWPLPNNQNHLDELARHTRKEPIEIQQILWDLRDQGVITILDGHVSDFSKERAWELLNEQVFFSERRIERRELGIHI